MLSFQYFADDYAEPVNISEEDLENHKSTIDFANLFSSNQYYFPEYIIEKYIDYYNISAWNAISCYQKLSESFIEKYDRQVFWGPIFANQELSEEFLIKHNDKPGWENTVLLTKVSDNFLIQFKDRLNWRFVCEYQDLSEEMSDMFFDYLYFENYFIYQDFSFEFFRRVISSLPMDSKWNWSICIDLNMKLNEETKMKIQEYILLL